MIVILPTEFKVRFNVILYCIVFLINVPINYMNKTHNKFVVMTWSFQPICIKLNSKKQLFLQEKNKKQIRIGED
jgi:hypothetical protein